jgi:ABC-type transport system involved in cytochrome bd biosynthesis fused ATPase/permease subunit
LAFLFHPPQTNEAIVFLEKGTITGIGTHDELVSTHEMYREFAAKQLRYNPEPSELMN